MGEDCLYLNVYAPASPGPPRPVLVWIHGGAFSTGSGTLYDGSQLAELGDLVVVTINYRLGVFGFVDLGSVTEEKVPSNLGLRDQIAALAWVQDNIAAFGGEPAQVTVAGESAGSVSAALLMSAPGTRGLFRAAIVQSGSYNLVHGPQVSQEVAHRYAAELGLRRGIGRRRGIGLAEISTSRLLAAQTAVGQATQNAVAAAPWFDGDVVPDSLDAARASTRPELAVLAGHTRDEITLFQLLPGDILPTTRPALSRRLYSALEPDRAADILAAYPDTRAGTRALGTDLNFALPTVHLAERHRVAGGTSYVYRFDAPVPLLGATHATDLPYLWDWSGLAAVLLRGRWTAARQASGQRLRRHWTSFVREGRPGSDWPAFDVPERATMIFSPAGDRVKADPAGPRRAAWAGLDVMPRD